MLLRRWRYAAKPVMSGSRMPKITRLILLLLYAEVEKLARENRFDYLLIESSGISDRTAEAAAAGGTDLFVCGRSQWHRPVPLCPARYAGDGGGCLQLPPRFRLTRQCLSTGTEPERRNAGPLDPSDTRSIVNLLTDQIEFANVIILNKTDLLNPVRWAS